jgi:ParB-like chromosome segregation protein Spo0J
MGEKSDREIKALPPGRLQDHPLNSELYRPRTKCEIEEIARHLDAGEHYEPVEVTPDFVIISGHGRCAAASLLKWKTIRCWIRRDLAKAGPDAVKQRLIEANLHRRQLSRLDMVRSYEALKRLGKGRAGQGAGAGAVKGDLRDILAKRFKLSGRSLDRWLQVLKLPIELQAAVDDGALKLTVAVQAAAEPKAKLDKAAEEVRKGTSAREAVARCLGKKAERRASPRTAFERLLRGLSQAQLDLAGRLAEVREGRTGDPVKQLRAGIQLFSGLIRHFEELRRRHAEALKRLPGFRAANDEEE